MVGTPLAGEKLATRPPPRVAPTVDACMVARIIIEDADASILNNGEKIICFVSLECSTSSENENPSEQFQAASIFFTLIVWSAFSKLRCRNAAVGFGLGNMASENLLFLVPSFASREIIFCPWS